MGVVRNTPHQYPHFYRIEIFTQAGLTKPTKYETTSWVSTNT